MSNYTGIEFELFVIGCLRHSHVNYARFNGSLLNVSYSFLTQEKRYNPFRSKEIQKTLLIPKFVIDTIN